MTLSAGMKRLRVFCILLVLIPLFILGLLGINQAMRFQQYESAVPLLVTRTIDPFGLVEQFDCVSSLEIDGERVELFVMRGTTDHEHFLRFCQIMQESAPDPTKYRAYVFDDEMTAKAQADPAKGIQFDENGREHLKAAYVDQKLIMISTENRHSFDQP